VSFDVAGKVVIVAGASTGIGSWMAQGLGAAGARLALAARRKEMLDEIAAGSGDAIAVACDLTSDEDRERLVQTTLDHYGRIDGLVNNAAVMSVVPALKESAEDFRRTLDINLVAPFDLARRVVGAMREIGGGSIVNVTSASATRTVGANFPAAAYCASKAGLAHLTRELAVQWGRYNVRVNSVAPGFFATEMTGNPEGPPEWAADQIALGRLGGGSDMVATVQFLLSDEAAYITGTEIAVDGGQSKA
jgi:NAD(P)-dependent dehydrogenase (short-subunit alcohol dehydrogenase family)